MHHRNFRTTWMGKNALECLLYLLHLLPFFFVFVQVCLMFLIVLLLWMFIVCYWEGEKRRLSWKDCTGIFNHSDFYSLKLFVIVVGALIFIFGFFALFVGCSARNRCYPRVDRTCSKDTSWWERRASWCLCHWIGWNYR